MDPADPGLRSLTLAATFTHPPPTPPRSHERERMDRAGSGIRSLTLAATFTNPPRSPP
jgi:hypothetical protein